MALRLTGAQLHHHARLKGIAGPYCCIADGAGKAGNPQDGVGHKSGPLSMATCTFGLMRCCRVLPDADAQRCQSARWQHDCHLHQEAAAAAGACCTESGCASPSVVRRRQAHAQYVATVCTITMNSRNGWCAGIKESLDVHSLTCRCHWRHGQACG